MECRTMSQDASIPFSDFIHYIYQIQHIIDLIMSQYAYHIYNTQPFSGQLGDASMMLTYYDPGEVHYVAEQISLLMCN